MEEVLIECKLWVPLLPLTPEQPLACCTPTSTPTAIKMPGPGPAGYMSPVPAQLYPQFAPLGYCSHPGLVPSPCPLDMCVAWCPVLPAPWPIGSPVAWKKPALPSDGPGCHSRR